MELALYAPGLGYYSGGAEKLGADGDFTLYSDDGKTYAYERGEAQITHLHWDDKTRALTHTGANAWSGNDASVVRIIEARP